MKKNTALTFILLQLYIYAHSQHTRLSEIGISQLFIWNRTTIHDVYSGTRTADKTGKEWSFGTNAHYSFTVSKNIYATIGVGYYDQRFTIRRGFDFYEPNVVSSIFYTTKNYAYKNLHYFGGLGYRININPKRKQIFLANSELRLMALYNGFSTFRQEFRHTYADDFLGNPNPMVRKSNYHFGSAIYIKGGLLCPLIKKIKAGADVVLPVFNRWRKDFIFRENVDDYYGADFSMGVSLNLIYNLN